MILPQNSLLDQYVTSKDYMILLEPWTLKVWFPCLSWKSLQVPCELEQGFSCDCLTVQLLPPPGPRRSAPLQMTVSIRESSFELPTQGHINNAAIGEIILKCYAMFCCAALLSLGQIYIKDILSNCYFKVTWYHSIWFFHQISTVNAFDFYRLCLNFKLL